MFGPTDEQGRFVRELREGSMAARFFAKAIDGFVFTLIGAVAALVSARPWAAALGPVLFLVSDALASPGKWLLRLEAVRVDGGTPGLFGSVSRNATLALPPLAAVLLGARLVPTALAPGTEAALVGCVGLLLLAVESFTLLIAPQSRRWSDQFSGTRVVRR